MRRWLKDSRVALRALMRRPLFSLSCILSLALGIGATATVFSVLDAFVLQPLPIPKVSQVMLIWQNNAKDPDEHHDVSPANFVDWRKRAKSFQTMAAFTGGSVRLTGGSTPEQLRAMKVTQDFFSVLGAAPVHGRVFTGQDTAGGKTPVAILGQGLWQRRFAEDPGIVGRRVVLDGVGYTVIGIMPKGWYILPSVDLFLPLGWPPTDTPRDDHYLRVVGRLAPGVTPDQASDEMSAIADSLAREYPKADAGYGVTAKRLQDVLPNPRDRNLLMVILGIVLSVLLISCANVANLLFARAVSRESELALRSVLGAERWPLIRQLLLESVELGLAGAVAGLVLSLEGVKLVAAFFPASALPGTEITVNYRVLLAAIAVGALTGLVTGLLPAWRASRPNVLTLIQEQSRATTLSRARHWLGRALVSVQFAVALMLLTFSLLMIATFVRLRDTDPGFPTDHLVTMRLDLPSWEYGKDQFTEHQQVTSHFREIYRRLKALPGVESVGATTVLPRSASNPKTSFQVVGRPASLAGEAPVASWRAVSVNFFKTLGVPLVKGREFEEADRIGSPSVLVVNQALVNQYFPGQDPLGQQLQFFDEKREIVGVVEDFLETRSPNASPTIYLPHAQSPRLGMSLMLRTKNEPESVMAAVPRAVWDVDHDLPVTDLLTFQQHLKRQFAGIGVVVDLLIAFSVLALFLAGLGVYGLMAYIMAQRIKEFGIRMALGARRQKMLGMIVREALLLCSVGVILGALLLIPLREVVTKRLGGLVVVNLGAVTIIVVLLAIVSLAAALGPAWRASRINPTVALNAE